MTDDGRKTVGVTNQGDQNLDALMQTGWFPSEIAAYLLAITTSLSWQLSASRKPLTKTKTKFNVGSLDGDGRLRDIVTLMGGDAVGDPYEYAERLADIGLQFLKTRIVDQNQMLSEAIDPELAETSADT